MKQRVSDFIIDFLEKKSVTNVFMLSGGGMMHLQDALSRSSRIKYVCHHHEQAACFAAEAFARQKESLGVCFATSGPGIANTLTSIISAYQDSSPLLVFGGQAKQSETIRSTKMDGLRQLGTFEVDMVPILKTVTKSSVFVSDPKLIRFELEKAYHLATTSRPGPCYLELPLDVQGALIETESLAGFDPQDLGKPIVDQNFDIKQFETVIEKFKSSKRPLILAGHGVRVSKSVDLIRKLVAELEIPVVTTMLAADSVPYENSYFIGRVGLKADRPGNFCIQTADFVLGIGCSFHPMTTGYELELFAPDAYKVQVDPDLNVLKKPGVKIDLKILADTNDFLKKLIKEKIDLADSVKRSRKIWLKHNQELKEKYSIFKEPHLRNNDECNFYDIIEELGKVLPRRSTVVADAGSAFYITGQAIRLTENQRFIACGALAQMGYTLPASTGVAFASPEITVIGVTGDGSFQTNIHELSVIRHHNLNIKIIVVNNSGYSCIRNTQKNYFNSYFSGTDESCGVWMPKFKDVATTYNIPHYLIENKNQLEKLGSLLNLDGPIVCEIYSRSDQEFIPSVTSVRLENGKMQSRPLHDLYPFLDPKEVDRVLSVKEAFEKL